MMAMIKPEELGRTSMDLENKPMEEENCIIDVTGGHYGPIIPAC